MFFILQRSLSRALDLSEEAVVFSVCNRAIELVDQEALSTGAFQNPYLSTGSDGTSVRGGSSSYSTSFTQLQNLHIFEVLARRSFYVDIFRTHCIAQDTRVLTAERGTSFATPQKAGLGSSLEQTSGNCNTLLSASSLMFVVWVEVSEKEQSELSVMNVYANNIGADLAVGTMALAEAAGGFSV